MKIVLAVLAALLGAFLLIGTANAERAYNQAELDAMLAPIALQPDGVVSQVLIASEYPDEVAAAAGWSRANPHLRGDDALRAVQNEPWDPAVKALVAFPELLARMDESPQWMRDLGEAFELQEPQVMDTVQALRRRAQAAGYLSSTDQRAVYQQGGAIVVQPMTQYVDVRYYDPYVVYGPWWWPHYRPVLWRPWVPAPVFVSHTVFFTKPDWHHHRVHRHHVHRPVHSHGKHVVVKPHVRVPEAQRKPIVQQHHPSVQQHHPSVKQHHPSVKQHHPSVQQQMPAASGFTGGSVKRNASGQHRSEGDDRGHRQRGHNQGRRDSRGRG